MFGAMAKRRRPTRAVRRRIRQTLANAARRARGAAVGEEPAALLRVARHVAQLDYLLSQGAITADMARAGARFARDFEHSATVPGRLVGRYEADVIRRPGKGSAPPDTPATIAARERFEAAVLELGPMWGITFHVAVCNLEPGVWGVPPGGENSDAMTLLRLGLAALERHYARRLSSLTGKLSGPPAEVPTAMPPPAAAERATGRTPPPRWA